MNYHITWKPEAAQQLADAWVSAADRQAVTATAYRIEQVLSLSPNDAGESRELGRRVLFIAPLGATFEIIEDDRKVNILRVRSLNRRH